MIKISKLSEAIFLGGRHRLSSPFGKRRVISTSKGKTSSFHSGADYSTFGVKLPQYAVADGKVTSCGRDEKNGGALFVWAEYPSLGVKMLHYHLDSIAVAKGQRLDAGTFLGFTGESGRATGIHLHLGIKRLSGGGWIDPEAYSAEFEKAKGNAKPKPGIYRVKADVLNVRCGAGLSFRVKSFSQLSADAQRKIKKLSGRRVNGYVEGLVFTALEVRDADGFFWGRTPSGWVALSFCERVKE